MEDKIPLILTRCFARKGNHKLGPGFIIAYKNYTVFLWCNPHYVWAKKTVRKKGCANSLFGKCNLYFCIFLRDFGNFVLSRLHRVFCGLKVLEIGVSIFFYALRYLSFHFPCRSSKSVRWFPRNLKSEGLPSAGNLKNGGCWKLEKRSAVYKRLGIIPTNLSQF